MFKRLKFWIFRNQAVSLSGSCQKETTPYCCQIDMFWIKIHLLHTAPTHSNTRRRSAHPSRQPRVNSNQWKSRKSLIGQLPCVAPTRYHHHQCMDGCYALPLTLLTYDVDNHNTIVSVRRAQTRFCTYNAPEAIFICMYKCKISGYEFPQTNFNRNEAERRVRDNHFELSLNYIWKQPSWFRAI